jgi:hypothetical protein
MFHLYAMHSSYNRFAFRTFYRYGQPPQDIINEIAPGLELDEDGMPKMNPLEGMFGGGGNEECRIM